MKSCIEPFARTVLRIQADFPETPYGIVKRLRVIDEWLSASGHPLRILDFGCGTGEQVTFPLAKAGHNVIGLDIHEPSIAEARRRFQLPNLEFSLVSPGSLTKLRRTFDVIVCSEVLEHLQAPSELLYELNEILEPQGLLIVTIPNGRGPYEMLCSLERCLTRLGIHPAVRRMMSAEPSQPRPNAGFLNWESQHIQFFKFRDVERLFCRSGFRIVNCRARTLLCGPYVDLLFRWMAFRKVLVDLNTRIADILPMECAADWMFLLRKA